MANKVIMILALYISDSMWSWVCVVPLMLLTWVPNSRSLFFLMLKFCSVMSSWEWALGLGFLGLFLSLNLKLKPLISNVVWTPSRSLYELVVLEHISFYRPRVVAALRHEGTTRHEGAVVRTPIKIL